MAREVTLFRGEQLAVDEGYSGAAWTVRPNEHVGHTRSVLGRVERDGRRTSLLVVRCSCGEHYRSNADSVDRALETEVDLLDVEPDH